MGDGPRRALHDYLAKRTAEEQLESVQVATVQLLLHNINSPLGTLRNCVTLLRGVSTNSDTAWQELAVITEAVEKASNRIGRIREDFARLLKSHESKPAGVDLPELLRKWTDDEVAEHKDVRVAYDLDSRLTTVVTDDVAARACVEVFVRNALEAFACLKDSRMHSIRIVLRPAEDHEREQLMSTGLVLAIEVQDDGPGVPEERRNSLFDIFRSSKSGGLGIGLVCCRRMLRATGGDVYLKDPVEIGAAFVALLPYEQVENENGGA